MNHSFDIDIASRYGIDIAIFLDHMAFWTTKNKANKKHFYDGRYWTYNSHEALAEIFPYWTPRQIKYLIHKCVSNNLIVIGNYNRKKYDRTNWYALSDLGLACFPSLETAKTQSQPHKTKLSHGSDKSVSPIPDTFTDTLNTSEQSSQAASTFSETTPVELVSIFADELPDNPQPLVNPVNGSIEKKVLKAIKEFKKHWRARFNKPLTEHGFRKYLQGLKTNCPGFVNNEYTNKGGRTQKNGLTVFLNWENFEGYLQNRIY